MRENKVVLVMVVVATMLMFLFLPTFTFHEEGLKGEYHFILNIPADHQINGPLILVEWLGIILMAAITWTLIGSRSNKLKKDRGSAQDATNAADNASANTGENTDSRQPEAGSGLSQSRK